MLWVKNVGGADFDRGFGIAVDGSGNAYVTGRFRDTAKFGGTTLTSSGRVDIFVVKFGASGKLRISMPIE